MENAFETSISIIKKAREQGVFLRLIGGLAVKAQCGEDDFCKREHGDIDLIGLSHQSSSIIKTIQNFGFFENTDYTITSGGTHLLFEKAESNDHIDVFLDKLRMEHEIDLRDRLDIEENTISISDLLVCKLIIDDLAEKDYRDIITLVKDSVLGEDDLPKTININYIKEMCAQNWGLQQDIITSLESCLDFMKNYQFNDVVAQDIQKKFLQMKKAISNYPKSARWKLRSYIGKRLAWKKKVELESREPESPF
jgi:hypothetical protein